MPSLVSCLCPPFSSRFPVTLPLLLLLLSSFPFFSSQSFFKASLTSRITPFFHKLRLRLCAHILTQIYFSHSTSRWLKLSEAINTPRSTFIMGKGGRLRKINSPETPRRTGSGHCSFPTALQVLNCLVPNPATGLTLM